MRIHHGIVLLSIVALASIGCTRVHVTRSGPHSAPAPNVGHGPPAHAPAHGYRKKYQYRYYPDAQVYYAADRGLYFWIEGGNWTLGARLPDHITVDLSSGVSVELDSDTPSAHHGKGGPKKGGGKGKGKGKGR